MDPNAVLAEQFQRSRAHLRAVAVRILGSPEDAEDALQEVWLRASRVDVSAVENLPGWLTTVTSRVCLDMLRARRRRPETPTDPVLLAPLVTDGVPDPADAVAQAGRVSEALLVVLDRLGPAERVAFMLHDLFAVPFDDIAELLDRSPDAAKKLASRARRQVHGTATVPAAELDRHRTVVEAFLAATRAGDLDALLRVLAPDVVRRVDRVAMRGQPAQEARGARGVATETVLSAGMARHAWPALVDGRIGVVVAPHGRLRFALRLVIDGDRVAGIDVIGEPDRLRRLVLAVVEPVTSLRPVASES
ncbi:DNA-directed RNA polymerase sigma-70 factor [Virgisporangium aliadipatigenens]|uniref:DNA-directed RNA polymerase sigma-70 factor n=1 Tax=Virgisporangium aliadipatigenens TaxID=741659 RepID=A0A8J3YHF1_9ACTN|nr:sigma-70 family RNA polymerase sigma factor [Virgisporangium aliadipatigenens]GIJ44001.1 DNA-directed RNA polymerase sigma-70 factor [Virgisporangium aliadipatigenens]